MEKVREVPNASRIFIFQRDGGSPHPVKVEEWDGNLILMVQDAILPGWPGGGDGSFATMRGKTLQNFIDMYITGKEKYLNGSFKNPQVGGRRRNRRVTKKSRRNRRNFSRRN